MHSVKKFGWSISTHIAISAFQILPGSAIAEDLPLNPAVTQETIGDTICIPGWTKTQRPPTSYSSRLKVKLIRKEGLLEELLVDFHLDHKIPLAPGGAPSDLRNFVLQPWDEADDKDRIEVCLARGGVRR